VRVRSIKMLGTPNNGSVPGSFTWGEISTAYCKGGEGLPPPLNTALGWNPAQAGHLNGILVTLLAGTYFQVKDGNPRVWPYDGTVSRYSAWAEGVSDAVIPHRTCWQGPLTHSIFASDRIKADWQTAITWNTAALERVNQAIDEADTALQQTNRRGCKP